MSNEYGSRQERRKAKSKGGKKKRGLFKKIFLAVLIVVLLALAAGGVGVLAVIHNAPDLNPELLDAPLSTTIYDKDNKAKTTLYHKENRSKIDIKKVPQTMKDAVISIEDRRFYKHSGIDLHRIAGAAVTDIKEGRLAEGGSTITQQVVKRVALSANKTFTRKIQEAYLSLKLEQKYSKDQILEMYLNRIFYGNQAYGIATASETYFGTKDLNKLNLSQMAILAGLPNAPATYDPFKHPKKAAERRNKVLQTMLDTGSITQKQAQKAKSQKVKGLLDPSEKNKNDSDKMYKAFEDTVYHELVNELSGQMSKKEIEKEFYQGGLKIYTTLDSDAQKHVYQLLHSDKVAYPGKYFNAGLSLIDTQNGSVRAVGGGRKFKSIGDYNYGSQQKRYPGSTIKPIMDYGPAVDYLKWSTYHPIKDEPFHYKGRKHKEIHNWDQDYDGELTLRQALARSRNVPALKTFYEVGNDKARDFAKGLGIQFKDETIPDASAIGSFEPGVSPMQLAGAFAAFGNEGVYHKPYTIRKVVFPDGRTIEPDHEPKAAMHDYTAYMITDMLKSVITDSHGTGTQVNLPGLPVAGKTGSVGLDQKFKKKHNVQDSSSLSDEWFTGYTSEYTASVWTGYPSLADKDGNVHYMDRNTKKVAIALFNQLMNEVSSQNVKDFKMPDSVKKLTVDKKSGKLAGDGTPSDQKITELFVKGNEPTETSDKYEKPDAPKNLKADYDEDDDEINLSWDYGDDDDISFEIQQATDNESFQKVESTDDKDFTVKHPDEGSAYRFKVFAVDTDSENRSDPAEAKVDIEKADEDEDHDNDQQPEAPDHAKADYDQDNQQIKVTWSGSDEDSIAYSVEQSKDNGPFQPVQQTTNDTQFIVTQPEPGTRYRYRITAINTDKDKKSDPVTTNEVQTGDEDHAANGDGDGDNDDDDDDNDHDDDDHDHGDHEDHDDHGDNDHNDED